jgi:hypothetical protein
MGNNVRRKNLVKAFFVFPLTFIPFLAFGMWSLLHAIGAETTSRAIPAISIVMGSTVWLGVIFLAWRSRTTWDTLSLMERGMCAGVFSGFGWFYVSVTLAFLLHGVYLAVTNHLILAVGMAVSAVIATAVYYRQRSS